MANNVPYTEAQRLIDEELAALRARTREQERLLNARRNALAPVAKLANEIIVNILLLVRGTSGGDTTGWILMASQTCRHWWNVAIDSPTLWTRIYVRSHEFTKLMLKRSRHAPLDVYFFRHEWPPSADCAVVVSSVMLEIARIRTLSFVDQAPTVLDAAQGFTTPVACAAPVLKTLVIHAHNVDDSGRRFRLTPFLFAATNNRLQTLALTNVQLVSWQSLCSIASGLRCFELRDTDTATAVTGHQFADVLSLMTNLEELTIDFDDIQLHQYTAPTPTTPAATRPKDIQLHRLKLLNITSRGRMEAIEAFLLHATYPRLRGLNITCGAPENPVSYSSTIHAIAHSCQTSVDALKRPAALEIYGNRFFISSAPPPPPTVAWKFSKNPYPYVDVSMPLATDLRGDETDVAVVSDILTCFKPRDGPNADAGSSLFMLCLGDVVVSAEEFIQLFAHLPSLSSIEVLDGTLGLALFEALAITSVVGTGGEQEGTADVSASFPYLKTITWKGVPGYVGSHSRIRAEVFELLYGGLSARYNCGAAISTLELVGLEHLNPHQMGQLSKVVRRVNIRQY